MSYNSGDAAEDIIEVSFLDDESFDFIEGGGDILIADNFDAFEYDYPELYESESFVQLRNKLSGMTPEQAAEYVGENQAEFLGAILPALGGIVSAALPVIKTALPTILPSLASALPSVLGSFLPKAIKTAAPIVGKIAGAVLPAVAPSGVPGATGNPLQALLGLLQNPQVIQALGNFASAGVQSMQTVPGSAVPVPDILKTVSQLSATAAVRPANASEDYDEAVFPEYAFDPTGKLLIDPNDPVQRANLILQLVN